MCKGEGEPAPIEPPSEPAEKQTAAREDELLTLFQRLAAEQAAVAEMLTSEAARLQRIQEQIDSWQPAAEWLNPPKEGQEPGQITEFHGLPAAPSHAPWAACAFSFTCNDTSRQIPCARC
jgi:hypothetical protein